MGATGGTQTHSRRTGSKLRQLHCTRQGLVRVPESNTKYGGKDGKTGVASRLLCRQVSVSPQGFPSEKNCFKRANSGFIPLFTGQLFIALKGLPREDSREATETSGQACRRRQTTKAAPVQCAAFESTNQMMLRAGMPQAVIAEIGSRLRIVNY
jgi:hypothetical protein